MNSTGKHPAATGVEGYLEHGATVYRTLLESTKAIPWKIDWATVEFSHIDPQIEPLLGWAPSNWKIVQDWATQMHPEDRDKVVEFCVVQGRHSIPRASGQGDAGIAFATTATGRNDSCVSRGSGKRARR